MRFPSLRTTLKLEKCSAAQIVSAMTVGFVLFFSILLLVCQTRLSPKRKVPISTTHIKSGFKKPAVRAFSENRTVSLDTFLNKLSSISDSVQNYMSGRKKDTAIWNMTLGGQAADDETHGRMEYHIKNARNSRSVLKQSNGPPPLASKRTAHDDIKVRTLTNAVKLIAPVNKNKLNIEDLHDKKKYKSDIVIRKLLHTGKLWLEKPENSEPDNPERTKNNRLPAAKIKLKPIELKGALRSLRSACSHCIGKDHAVNTRSPSAPNLKKDLPKIDELCTDLPGGKGVNCRSSEVDLSGNKQIWETMNKAAGDITTSHIGNSLTLVNNLLADAASASEDDYVNYLPTNDKVSILAKVLLRSDKKGDSIQRLSNQDTEDNRAIRNTRSPLLAILIQAVQNKHELTKRDVSSKNRNVPLQKRYTHDVGRDSQLTPGNNPHKHEPGESNSIPYGKESAGKRPALDGYSLATRLNDPEEGHIKQPGWYVPHQADLHHRPSEPAGYQPEFGRLSNDVKTTKEDANYEMRQLDKKNRQSGNTRVPNNGDHYFQHTPERGKSLGHHSPVPDDVLINESVVNKPRPLEAMHTIYPGAKKVHETGPVSKLLPSQHKESYTHGTKTAQPISESLFRADTDTMRARGREASTIPHELKMTDTHSINGNYASDLLPEGTASNAMTRDNPLETILPEPKLNRLTVSPNEVDDNEANRDEWQGETRLRHRADSHTLSPDVYSEKEGLEDNSQIGKSTLDHFPIPIPITISDRDETPAIFGSDKDAPPSERQYDHFGHKGNQSPLPPPTKDRVKDRFSLPGSVTKLPHSGNPDQASLMPTEDNGDWKKADVLHGLLSDTSVDRQNYRDKNPPVGFEEPGLISKDLGEGKEIYRNERQQLDSDKKLIEPNKLYTNKKSFEPRDMPAYLENEDTSYQDSGKGRYNGGHTRHFVRRGLVSVDMDYNEEGVYDTNIDPDRDTQTAPSCDEPDSGQQLNDGDGNRLSACSDSNEIKDGQIRSDDLGPSASPPTDDELKENRLPAQADVLDDILSTTFDGVRRKYKARHSDSKEKRGITSKHVNMETAQGNRNEQMYERSEDGKGLYDILVNLNRFDENGSNNPRDFETTFNDKGTYYQDDGGDISVPEQSNSMNQFRRSLRRRLLGIDKDENEDDDGGDTGTDVDRDSETLVAISYDEPESRQKFAPNVEVTDLSRGNDDNENTQNDRSEEVAQPNTEYNHVRKGVNYGDATPQDILINHIKIAEKEAGIEDVIQIDPTWHANDTHDDSCNTVDEQMSTTTTKGPAPNHVITVGLHKKKHHDLYEGITNKTSPDNTGHVSMSKNTIIQVETGNGSDSADHVNSNLLLDTNQTVIGAMMNTEGYLNTNSSQEVLPILIGLLSGADDTSRLERNQDPEAKRHVDGDNFNGLQQRDSRGKVNDGVNTNIRRQRIRRSNNKTTIQTNSTSNSTIAPTVAPAVGPTTSPTLVPTVTPSRKEPDVADSKNDYNIFNDDYKSSHHPFRLNSKQLIDSNGKHPRQYPNKAAVKPWVQIQPLHQEGFVPNVGPVQPGTFPGGFDGTGTSRQQISLNGQNQIFPQQYQNQGAVGPGVPIQPQFQGGFAPNVGQVQPGTIPGSFDQTETLQQPSNSNGLIQVPPQQYQNAVQNNGAVQTSVSAQKTIQGGAVPRVSPVQAPTVPPIEVSQQTQKPTTNVRLRESNEEKLENDVFETEASINHAGIKSAKKSKSPIFILNKPKFYSGSHREQPNRYELNDHEIDDYGRNPEVDGRRLGRIVLAPPTDYRRYRNGLGERGWRRSHVRRKRAWMTERERLYRNYLENTEVGKGGGQEAKVSPKPADKQQSDSYIGCFGLRLSKDLREQEKFPGESDMNCEINCADHDWQYLFTASSDLCRCPTTLDSLVKVNDHCCSVECTETSRCSDHNNRGFSFFSVFLNNTYEENLNSIENRSSTDNILKYSPVYDKRRRRKYKRASKRVNNIPPKIPRVKHTADYIKDTLKSKKMEYIGCYKKMAGKVQPSKKVLSAESCRIVCRHTDKPYAGSYNGGKCVCGSSIDASNKLSDDKCFTRCKANMVDTCGGPGSAVSVFRSSLDSQYVGCLQQDISSEDTVFMTSAHKVTKIHQCREFCRLRGWRFAALSGPLGGDKGVSKGDKQQNKCRCGSSLERLSSSPNWCKLKCVGDPRSFCGNTDTPQVETYSVYFSKLNGNMEKEPFEPDPTKGPIQSTLTFLKESMNTEGKEYLGCFDFRDHDTRFFLMPATTSVFKCRAHCMTRGFRYAASIRGVMCKCTDNTEFTNEYKEVKCNMNCPKEKSMICGGKSFSRKIKGKKTIMLKASIYRADYKGSYVGCFRINEKEKDMPFNGPMKKVLSLRDCRLICARQKRIFSANLRVDHCRCGDNLAHVTPVRDSFCNVPCKAVSNTYCGGKTSSGHEYASVHFSDINGKQLYINANPLIKKKDNVLVRAPATATKTKKMTKKPSAGVLTTTTNPILVTAKPGHKKNRKNKKGEAKASLKKKEDVKLKAEEKIKSAELKKQEEGSKKLEAELQKRTEDTLQKEADLKKKAAVQEKEGKKLRLRMEEEREKEDELMARQVQLDEEEDRLKEKEAELEDKRPEVSLEPEGKGKADIGFGSSKNTISITESADQYMDTAGVVHAGSAVNNFNPVKSGNGVVRHDESQNTENAVTPPVHPGDIVHGQAIAENTTESERYKDAIHIPRGDDGIIPCIKKDMAGSFLDPKAVWFGKGDQQVVEERFTVEDSGDLLLQDAQAKDTGTYKCKVKGTDESGLQFEKTFTRQVLVYSPPNFTYDVSFKFKTDVCDDLKGTQLQNNIRHQLMPACPTEATCTLENFNVKCHFVKDEETKRSAKLRARSIKHKMFVTFALKPGLNFKYPNCDFQCMKDAILQYLDQPYRTIEKIIKEMSEQEKIQSDADVSNTVVDPVSLKKVFIFTCPSGYHLYGMICGPCHPGHSSLAKDPKCHKCEKGTYQPEFAQGMCSLCPQNASTNAEGTINAADCKGQTILSTLAHLGQYVGVGENSTTAIAVIAGAAVGVLVVLPIFCCLIVGCCCKESALAKCCVFKICPCLKGGRDGGRDDDDEPLLNKKKKRAIAYDDRRHRKRQRRASSNSGSW